MPSDELRFQLRYIGPVPDEGRMEVRELAPALLATANLFGATAAVISGDPKTRLKVDVIADFRHRSFGVDMSVLHSVEPDSVSHAFSLVELAGVLLGSGGLFQVVKWLRGRKIEKAERTDTHGRLVAIDGDYTDVNVHVVNLIDNEEVRRYLTGTVWPVRSKGIERISIEREDQEPVEVTKEEVPYFTALGSGEGDVLSDTESDQVVKLHTIPIDAVQSKWRFKQGDALFWAQITDATFLDQCEGHKVVFGVGDALAVRLRTIARGIPHDPEYERQVVKVYRVLTADRPVQGNIFEESF